MIIGATAKSCKGDEGRPGPHHPGRGGGHERGRCNLGLVRTDGVLVGGQSTRRPGRTARVVLIRLPSGRGSIPVSSVSLPTRRVILRRVLHDHGRRRSQGAVHRPLPHHRHAWLCGAGCARVPARASRRVGQECARAGERHRWLGHDLPDGADAKFPAKRGSALVVFVRARKPGGDLLAGVSTRRLAEGPHSGPSSPLAQAWVAERPVPTRASLAPAVMAAVSLRERIFTECLDLHRMVVEAGLKDAPKEWRA